MIESVQTVLLAEFKHRTNKNNSYSLRAFARDMQLHPSHLSSVLHNKAGLSKAKASEIAHLLKFDAKKKRRFIELVESQFARNQVQRNLALKQLKKLELKYRQEQRVDHDLFNLISDWWHFAILELCYLKFFCPTPEAIAHDLGIDRDQAEQALLRLLKFNLLKVNNGQLTPTEDYSCVTGDIPSASIRRFHADILKKAQVAVEKQTIEERCLRSSFLAIKKDKLKEAFAAIAKFHEDFCEDIGNSSTQSFEKDEVYALSTQFFKITDKSEGASDD